MGVEDCNKQVATANAHVEDCREKLAAAKVALADAEAKLTLANVSVTELGLEASATVASADAADVVLLACRADMASFKELVESASVAPVAVGAEVHEVAAS